MRSGAATSVLSGCKLRAAVCGTLHLALARRAGGRRSGRCELVVQCTEGPP